MHSDTWRQAVVTLATVVIAMAGFWMIEGREFVTRVEVAGIVQAESPYLPDRAMIQSRLADSVEATRALTKAVSNLEVTLARLDERLRHNEGRNGQ
jgi:hypothetical protein